MLEILMIVSKYGPWLLEILCSFVRVYKIYKYEDIFLALRNLKFSKTLGSSEFWNISQQFMIYKLSLKNRILKYIIVENGNPWILVKYQTPDAKAEEMKRFIICGLWLAVLYILNLKV